VRNIRALPRRTHSSGLAGPSSAAKLRPFADAAALARGAFSAGAPGVRTAPKTRSFAGANAQAPRSGGGAALIAASSERMMFAQKWSMFRSFLSYPNGSGRRRWSA
jgi:hypothetical protein